MEGDKPDFQTIVTQADAAYRPFPPFSEWAKASLSSAAWDECKTRLGKLKEQSDQSLRRSLDIVRRAAAVDTGALEGLYETDWGFTLTVAAQTAHFEKAFADWAADARALVQAQIDAYDYVLDFATRKVPIAEAWIRELHQQICAAQATYKVFTEVGWQEQALPRGGYKTFPNHVLEPSGTVHSYAPVSETPTEVQRFCEELRTMQFETAHPILQAAYAHYGRHSPVR